MPQPLSALEHASFLKVLVIGPPKSSKAQPLDEPVLTPTGWAPIGEIRPGALVIGSGGEPVVVRGVYPQGRKKIVRVATDDGASTRCSEDHLWHTTTANELDQGRYYRPREGDLRLERRPTGNVGRGSVKTARQIAETLNETHYLPRLARAVRFDCRSLPGFDPYYLGLLLGDGSTRCEGVRYFSTDEELLATVEASAKFVGDEPVRFDYSDRCPGVRVNGGVTKALLERLGLYGKTSPEKFIPKEIFSAPPELRLMMLQGLMDTDGSVDRSDGHQAVYTTTSEALRDGVVDIVRSLGGRARVSLTPEPKFQNGIGLPAWHVAISFYDDTCPFRLTRKKDLWTNDRERLRRQRIVSVESEGEAECVCIRVGAEDSLYVTKDYILTHNTTISVCTSPRPVRVLLCEDQSALEFPLLVLRDEEGLSAKQIGDAVDFDVITGESSMLKAIIQARHDAEAGAIKTVVVDPLTFFADKLLEETFAVTKSNGGNEDGRRAHPEATRRMRKVVDQLLRLPCNVVVVSHYLDVGDAAKGGGDGKVPMLPNREMRSAVAGMFPNIVWIDIKTGDYKFVTTPKGAFGPGCRGLKGHEEIPADIQHLMAALGLAPKAALQRQGVHLGGDSPKPTATPAAAPAKQSNVKATTPPPIPRTNSNSNPKVSKPATTATVRR